MTSDMGEMWNERRERRPMWYDDFDAELYKVVPEAERLIAPLAHVEMRTVGQPDRQTGRLNHPSMWNHDHSMVAFFGCKLQAMRHWKPEFYTSSRETVIECTFEEAIRDTWVHDCLMIVDGVRLWNSWKLCDAMMGLMAHLRGWRHDDAAAANYRKRTLREVDRACRKLSAWLAVR